MPYPVLGMGLWVGDFYIQCLSFPTLPCTWPGKHLLSPLQVVLTVGVVRMLEKRGEARY